ncbi:MAG: hypothetical protein Q8O13_00005 [Candidatus Omnitrophota bacterium]|nr:hypothetical protein [Candidatus Omnitrophota bacterium]
MKKWSKKGGIIFFWIAGIMLLFEIGIFFICKSKKGPCVFFPVIFIIPILYWIVFWFIPKIKQPKPFIFKGDPPLNDPIVNPIANAKNPGFFNFWLWFSILLFASAILLWFWYTSILNCNDCKGKLYLNSNNDETMNTGSGTDTVTKGGTEKPVTKATTNTGSSSGGGGGGGGSSGGNNDCTGYAYEAYQC